MRKKELRTQLEQAAASYESVVAELFTAEGERDKLAATVAERDAEIVALNAKLKKAVKDGKTVTANAAPTPVRRRRSKAVE